MRFNTAKLAAALKAVGAEKSAGVVEDFPPEAGRLDALPLSPGQRASILARNEPSLRGGISEALRRMAILRRRLRALESRAAERRKARKKETFRPEEIRQFKRFGLDPELMRFLPTLSAHRKGMALQERLISEALSGRMASPAGGAEEEEVTPYV